jgi:hypothetical protein
MGTDQTTLRRYQISLSEHQAYEAGAMLITLLAFPKETADDTTFRRIHESICAEALIERARNDPSWAFTQQTIRPLHMAISETRRKRDLRTLDRRLRDRMLAGRIANAIIFDETGLNPKLPKGFASFSIKQLIYLSLEQLGSFEGENAEQRIWRDGRAAIHLAAATQAYLNRPEVAEYEVSIGDIIFDADAVVWIVLRAQETERLMAEHPGRLLGTTRGIIRLELTAT